MTTVDSISVGRFDQNLAVQRIPPPAAELAATPGAAGGHVPCSCRIYDFLLHSMTSYSRSQWLRVYDFLLHSMTHAAQKNTENRPEDSKSWPLECLNKGSVYAHVCVSSKPLVWTSSTHHMPERCAKELSRA
jgi:hypothetical protein